MRAKTVPSLVSSSHTQPAAQESDILNPQPFYTEFYRQQFAAERAAGRDVHSSWLSPVITPLTTAASNMSKRVASLRHAIVRMMP
ncbi:MAG: hypothetical protein JOZ10_04745 [Acidobacteria bacterium]|nr:hypothetical protein [Acidobacteriota bacterium]